jgi:DNA-binding NarL/FixJ family response regulator
MLDPTLEPYDPEAPPPPEPPAMPESFVGGRGWSRSSDQEGERPLTARERQIVGLIGEGKTPKEIAYELAIAHSTVRVIYSRAMKKLGGVWQPRGRAP